MIIHVAIFILSCLLLILSGNWLVKSLKQISIFLGLNKFVVAFLLMSVATALPELLVGVTSAIRGVSELSFGNIIGQNIIHFTVAIFICVLIGGGFYVRSKTIRTTAFFSGFMALFPLVLILDGSLSRSDGLILIGLFSVYVFRMLRDKKHHEQNFNNNFETTEASYFIKKIINFFRAIGKFVVGSAILIFAAQGIVTSSMFFASSLGIPLVFIGILIVGLGTALPEIVFSAFSASQNDTELVAGNLLGSTAVSTSLVLGLVSIISPITGIQFFSYFLSRLILFISVIFFWYFMLTDRKISLKEGTVLLGIYFIFVLLEILI